MPEYIYHFPSNTADTQLIPSENDKISFTDKVKKSKNIKTTLTQNNEFSQITKKVKNLSLKPDQKKDDDENNEEDHPYKILRKGFEGLSLYENTS